MFVRKSTYASLEAKLKAYEKALNDIADQRTEWANATVTRMANIAEKALGL